jgi:Icc protein
MRFSLILVVAAGLVLGLVKCGRDPLQFIFHPSTDKRFLESQALTAPSAFAINPEEFSFALFADIHVMKDHSSLVANFAKDILPKGIRFFVVLGDLTDDGTTDEFESTKSQLDATGIPYYVTIGNHDLYQSSEKGGWANFRKTFGPATYAVTLANTVRFVFLDTGSGEIGSEQFNWLQDQLSTPVRYTFVASHYGVFDGLVPKPWRLESVEERYKLMGILTRYKVYAHVAGHLHAFHHSTIAGIEHFIVGSMYPQSLDYGKRGYLLFRYQGGKLTWEWQALSMN